MGVNEFGVDEMGVDEMGSRRSGNKPFEALYGGTLQSITFSKPRLGGAINGAHTVLIGNTTVSSSIMSIIRSMSA